MRFVTRKNNIHANAANSNQLSAFSNNFAGSREQGAKSRDSVVVVFLEMSDILLDVL